MKILIATHHLLDYTGSELYTQWLAVSLAKRGHQVFVYSPFLGRLRTAFEQANIPLTDNLASWSQETFDIAHVHHNITAIEVRAQFPTVPIVMQIHGTIPLLEQLPREDLHISKLLAVSELVQQHLVKKGVDPALIAISRNGVDLDWWKSDRPASTQPKQALLLSAKIPYEKEKLLDEACQQLQIKLIKRGGRFGSVTPEIVRSSIYQSDFVITIGRGVVEGLACGRPVLVFDHLGGDGFITPDNFVQLMSVGFSGKFTATQYTQQQLVSILSQAYNPAAVPQLQALVKQYFDSSLVLSQLEQLYLEIQRTIIKPLTNNEQQTISRMAEYMRESRAYSRLQHRQELEVLHDIPTLVQFQQSKTFKLWRAFRR